MGAYPMTDPETEKIHPEKDDRRKIRITCGATTTGIQTEPILFLHGGREAVLGDSELWSTPLEMLHPGGLKSLDLSNWSKAIANVSALRLSDVFVVCSSTSTGEDVWFSPGPRPK